MKTWGEFGHLGHGQGLGFNGGGRRQLRHVAIAGGSTRGIRYRLHILSRLRSARGTVQVGRPLGFRSHGHYRVRVD